VTVGRTPMQRQFPQEAGDSVGIHQHHMTRVEVAAEHPARHPACEVGPVIELGGDAVPHRPRGARFDQPETGEREPVRLHKVRRRMDVVYPSRVRDGRE
jgi:hypothetical protein